MEKYTLIIAEKPDAAQRIASALSRDQKAKKMEDKGVPYYVVMRDKEIVVVPALGHLYTVSAETKVKNHYPVLNCKWVPRFLAEKGAQRTRPWLQVITKLSKDADAFVDACDYDMEGSVIGYCILKYACGGKEKESRRMKYSTLTTEELERSYVESMPHLDFALIEAGLTRHEVDWLYGINLSRALTIAAKRSSGKYDTLSTGRVQGPTLKFLVSREKSIENFVRTPYWQVRAQVEIDGQLCVAEYAKKTIETKKEANEILKACRGMGRVEKVSHTQFRESPPKPFDLGALQVEAYRLFGYGPKSTLNICQRLYLDALVSYPRTNSQKLPPSINYRFILGNLTRIQELSKLIAKLLTKPVLEPFEGNKDDPAHPAIYPTGNLPERYLNTSERNLWDLIVRRFIAVFGDVAITHSLNASLKVNGHVFFVEGRETVNQGWREFYEPYVSSERPLMVPVNEGEPVEFKRIIVINRFTKPPSRYNPVSLLQKMEKEGIGTKATRADVIEILYKRKYVRNERMTVTNLGLEIFETLKNHCPQILSVEMTNEFEERINGIRQNIDKKEDVLTRAVATLEPMLKQLKRKEKEIGERLSTAARKTRMEENVIGGCPACKTGKLVIIYSKKTGKRFIGCTNYFEELCTASFALPQEGTIRLNRRKCIGCEWPTVEVRKEKRKWVFCFNPDCPLKRGKKV